MRSHELGRACTWDRSNSTDVYRNTSCAELSAALNKGGASSGSGEVSVRSCQYRSRPQTSNSRQQQGPF